MAKQVYKPTSINVEILTPVSIGDGGSLSPLSDYFIQDGRVHRISAEKLEDYLEAEDLIDAYVDAVYQAADSSKIDFWTNDMGMDDPAFISSGRSFLLNAADNPTELKTIVRNGQHPYLPGSTVKGAIKTAILYQWLQEGPNSKLDTICNMLLDGRTKGERGRDEIDQVISDFMESMPREKPAEFQRLRVADSNPISENLVEIYQTKRLNMGSGKFDIPVPREALKPGVHNLQIPITILPEFEHKALQSINSKGIQDIFGRINKFSYAHLGWLMDTLEDQEEYIQENDYEGIFENLWNNLNTIYDKIETAGDNEAYIQIGAGKTYFSNSIGLAIMDKDLKAFSALKRIYRLGKAKQELFPISLTLTSNDFMPMGWIKLSF